MPELPGFRQKILVVHIVDTKWVHIVPVTDVPFSHVLDRGRRRVRRRVGGVRSCLLWRIAFADSA